MTDRDLKVRWSLASGSRDGGELRVKRIRDFSEERFDELIAKCRFIRDLAGIDSYARLIDSVGRWEGVLDVAAKELTQDGVVSRQTDEAVRSELTALARLSARLEDGLVQEVALDSDADPLAAERFQQLRHGVRASPPYLLIHQLARQAASGSVEVELVDGAVQFSKAGRDTAFNLACGLAGYLACLVAAHLEAFRRRFEVVADEVEALAAEVPEGSPGLVTFRADATSGDLVNYSVTELPLIEIRALKDALTESAELAKGPAGGPKSGMGLLANRLRTYVRFGAASADSGIVDGDLREGIDMVPTAELELDLDLLGSEPIDYWAPLTYALEQGPYREEKFAGAVQEAKVDGSKVELTCEGATDLTEHTTGGMVAENIGRAELVRSMILQAGWPEDLLRLSETIPSRPKEEFEVLVPLRGVEVDHAVTVAGVSLLPRQRGRDAIARFTLDDSSDTAARLKSEFDNATAYACAVVTTSEPHQAEDAGSAAIELALAWLVTRGRYGSARLPDGAALTFSRQQGLRSPRRGAVVLVHGQKTDRQWLRWPNSTDEPVGRKLAADSPALAPEVPDGLTVADRQALLALRRAAEETEPLSQVQLLVQAIECYLAGTKINRPVFSDAELGELREAFPAEISAEQRVRLDRLLGALNDPPFRAQLDWRLRHDGVPMTDAEHKLVKKLRDARNDVVHGSEVKKPLTREEMNYGLSLVSRMLVYRVARRSEQKSREEPRRAPD